MLDKRDGLCIALVVDPETLAQWGDRSVTATACVASCGDVRNGRPDRWETMKES